MASLTTLPPELLNLITTPLTLKDLLKIRLLNKSHNLKFQHYFRTVLFTNITINLSPSSSSSINTLSQLSPSTKSYIKTLTISTQTWSRGVPTPKNTIKLSTSVSTTLHSLPNLTTINLIDPPKTLLTSLLTTTPPPLQSLHCNAPSLSLTDLTFPPSQSSLTNSLTTLSISLKFPSTNHNHRQTLKQTSKLFTTLSSLTTLHTLTLKNTTCPSPSPLQHNHPKNFLPPTFSLPNLKSLSLSNINLTTNDITHVLFPNPDSSGIEDINFDSCRLQIPDKQWYEVIRYLLSTHGFKNLKSVYLGLGGYYPGISTYELPDLQIILNQPNPVCEVSLLLRSTSTEDEKKEYITFQNPISKIINNKEITNSDKFWKFLTNGEYNSPNIIKWKKIRLLKDTYDTELRKLRAYAQYDWNMAETLEKKFRRDLEGLEGHV
ncbi:hypothetical protein TWF506_009923 [Arthrobotrys conoides]|uniref:F-box domain-containing protein n=1 Tax=Arthrobotrys conoides TaxID=74498 RepID=A0AAN8N7L7_9PEZI